MEQEIRFTQVDGKRVAYATVGDGPPLLMPAHWVSHLELEWEDDGFREFVTRLAADRTVVRWNRIGTGMSDRDVSPEELTVGAEARTLGAIADRVGAEKAELLGISGAAATSLAWAAEHPERVERLLLWGSYAHGDGIAEPRVRAWMVDVVRSHWGLGARVMTDVFLAGATPEKRESFARLQRAAATADVAAAMIADYYARDVRDVLPRVSAPAIVVHRRQDRAVPYALGVELAAGLPDARLVSLEGVEHAPSEGDMEAALRALEVTTPRAAAPAAPANGGGEELSAREREVLALVAAGLSDAAIAERLYLSPHTVHRHVANIRVKLGQPSRAAAVAHAARLNLI